MALLRSNTIHIRSFEGEREQTDMWITGLEGEKYPPLYG